MTKYPDPLFPNLDDLFEWENEMDGLAVGRTVHYVAYGTPGGEYPVGICRAAIITDVINRNLGTVSLCVLNPTGMFFNTSIQYDELGKPGSWHWPEKV